MTTILELTLDALSTGFRSSKTDYELRPQADGSTLVLFEDGSAVRVEAVSDFSGQTSPDLITGAEHWDEKNY